MTFHFRLFYIRVLKDKYKLIYIKNEGFQIEYGYRTKRQWDFNGVSFPVFV